MNKENTPCMHFYCYLRKAGENCIIDQKYLKESDKYVNKHIKRQNSEVIWTVKRVTEEGFNLTRKKRDGEVVDFELDWDRFRKHYKVID